MHQFLKLLQANCMALQAGSELYVLEILEQVSVLLEVGLQVYVFHLYSHSALITNVIASIVIFIAKVVRFALQLLLEFQVGDLNRQICFNFHLFYDLQTL